MDISNHDTMALLKQLKHKRYNSEIPFHQFTSNQPLVTPSSAHGFSCPYHPTELVTNICVSPQSPSSKPLCPRCLQQHITAYQSTSNPASFKLEPCETQVESISQSLVQKIDSCHKLKYTIVQMDQWQAVQLQQIQSSLNQFRSSLLAQIEKEFFSLFKQIQSKWQTHSREYNETVKRLKENMSNLEDHCHRSLKLIGERKEIDTICSSMGVINKKYEELGKVQEKMLQCASTKIQGKFSTDKIGEIISSVKKSLELKISKVTGYEIDRILKQLSLKSAKQSEITQITNLNKLQKLFQTNTTKKLHHLQQNQSKPDPFSSSPNSSQSSKTSESSTKTQKTQNQNHHERVLLKLNDTTNKLKESLSVFSKSQKPKFYV